MTLSELKITYEKVHNENLVNLINEIETIFNNTHIPINKIITYIQANCASKIDRKNLNLLKHHYPYIGELTLNEVNLINNKKTSISSDTFFTVIEDEKSVVPEIKIEKFKNSAVRKSKKSKTENTVNNDIDNVQE